MLEQTPIEDETKVVSSEAPPAGQGADVGRGVDSNWRADLEARIEIHQALGLSRNEATAVALREIREAERTQYDAGRNEAGVRNQGRFSRFRKRRRSLSLSPPLFTDARAATGIALALFGLPMFDALSGFFNGWQGFLFRWWLQAYHLTPGSFNASQPALLACLRSYSRFEFLVIPLLAGLLTGLLARKNATRGVWNALALLAIPAILLPGILGGLAYAAGSSGHELFAVGEIAAMGIGYWALLGIGGARIGQWLRERQAGKRSRLASEASPPGKADMGRTHTRRFSLTPSLFSSAAATFMALPLFALAWWADNSTHAFALWQQFFQEERWKPLASTVLQIVRSSEDAGFYRFELFVIPVLIGLLTGLLVRRNAARGVLNALALLAIPALVLPGMVAASKFVGIIPDHFALNWLPNIKPAVNGIAIWGVLGAGSAQTVQWLKEKGRAIWNRNKGRGTVEAPVNIWLTDDPS